MAYEKRCGHDRRGGHTEITNSDLTVSDVEP